MGALFAWRTCGSHLSSGDSMLGRVYGRSWPRSGCEFIFEIPRDEREEFREHWSIRGVMRSPEAMAISISIKVSEFLLAHLV